ncbi:hypothetical protein [Leptodesmis sp.]|uniref:hypothetical protein n=1 Tax=Leptodesmis sp. TaxID=3100501 RepID=UPI0040534806
MLSDIWIGYEGGGIHLPLSDRGVMRDETRGGNGDAMVETIAHLPENVTHRICTTAQCAIATLFNSDSIV